MKCIYPEKDRADRCGEGNFEKQGRDPVGVRVLYIREQIKHLARDGQVLDGL
jgi:hypothetical protein